MRRLALRVLVRVMAAQFPRSGGNELQEGWESHADIPPIRKIEKPRGLLHLIAVHDSTEMRGGSAAW